MDLRQQEVDDLRSGKKKIITRFEYLWNYWTPIVGLLGFMIAGIFWFANANSRLFSNESIKYETEQNTIAARQRTFDKLDERYVKRTEVIELKDNMTTLAKEIRDLRIELAKKR